MLNEQTEAEDTLLTRLADSKEEDSKIYVEFHSLSQKEKSLETALTFVQALKTIGDRNMQYRLCTGIFLDYLTEIGMHNKFAKEDIKEITGRVNSLLKKGIDNADPNYRRTAISAYIALNEGDVLNDIKSFALEHNDPYIRMICYKFLDEHLCGEAKLSLFSEAFKIYRTSMPTNVADENIRELDFLAERLASLIPNSKCLN